MKGYIWVKTKVHFAEDYHLREEVTIHFADGLVLPGVVDTISTQDDRGMDCD